MLRPGARRKDVLRQWYRSSEQLLLPWLCPALLRYQSQSLQRRPVARIPSSAGGRNSKRYISQTSQRPATASALPPFAMSDPYIPFEDQGMPRSNIPWGRGSLLPDASNLDASSLVILDEQTVDSENQRFAASHHGVSGDPMEMRLMFQTCLRLHRYQRASSLLYRFAKLFREDRESVVALHNQYIQAMVSDIVLNRKPHLLQGLQRWFEVDMRTGVLRTEPDATTYALMTKVSLHTLHGPKRDRTVRRYWDLAKKSGIEYEVLTKPILTDAEMGKVTEICPMDLNLPDHIIPEMEEMQDTNLPMEYADDIPEVRPAHQKGLGLSSLKESLALFSEDAMDQNEPRESSTTEDLRMDAAERQTRLERDATISALERWRKEVQDLRKIGLEPSIKTRSVSTDLWKWSQVLQEKIRDEIREIKAIESETNPVSCETVRRLGSETALRMGYGPFLSVISPERLAAIAIIGVLSSVARINATQPLNFAGVACEIGNMVAREYEAEMAVRVKDKAAISPTSLTKKGREIAKIVRGYRRKPFMPQSPLKYQTQVDEEIDLVSRTWTKEVRAKVGAALVKMLMDSATITSMEEDPSSKQKKVTERAVFTHEMAVLRGKRIGIIRTDPDLLARLSREPTGNTISKQLPMVCEPRPWRNVRDGGFLTERFDVLRWREMSQRKYVQAAATRGDLADVFAGLDVLGRTRWKINRGLLKVMLDAWNSGDEIANIRAECPTVTYPEKPDNLDDPKAKRLYKNAVQTAENQISGYHSERCYVNLQLEIAKSFGNETFYFPHNLDFRGRAYPLSSYLNQMGADHCRALLYFANGKPLGADGLRWLKVHLANVYGYDKATLQEREDFAMEHLDDIHDSVVNPLGGKRWWLQAEDPWQTLATSMELKKALESPDPTAFVSHLPIHQDGSCNGLQHYAALGGDIVGAQQVNLAPGDRPADVYSGVADMVKNEIDTDAAAGVEVAEYLQGKITRKVVKQPVMTNVYGVTFIGAKEQVRRQLVNLLPGLPERGAPICYATTSGYITRKIFKCLSAMFTGAHEIQYWFGICANRIIKSQSPSQIDKLEKSSSTSRSRTRGLEWKSTVTWTTPLRLPVVQPYRKDDRKTIATVLQNVNLQCPQTSHQVDWRRQLQAFPPNFIHSLDASHMLMSALQCSKIGIDFAAVHDSFWTHASDINTMNRVLRDAFIRMHSDDIIGRLAAEFRTRYKGHLYACKIPSKSEVGKLITKHRILTRKEANKGKKSGGGVYRVDELILERKRQKLLGSSNPKERAEGRAMMTPASIYETHVAASPSSIMSPAELAAVESNVASQSIGHIPKSAEQMEAAMRKDEISAAADADTHAIEDMFSSEQEAEDSSVNDEHQDDNNKTENHQQPLADAEGEKSKQTIKRQERHLIVWLPLTFPEVPKKGEFDVGRLKESTYFFS